MSEVQQQVEAPQVTTAGLPSHLEKMAIWLIEKEPTFQARVAAFIQAQLNAAFAAKEAELSMRETALNNLDSADLSKPQSALEEHFREQLNKMPPMHRATLEAMILADAANALGGK